MKKHGGLLTDLTLEAHIWLDHKFGSCSFEFCSHLFPFSHGQHHTEMAYRYILSIDRTGVFMAGLIRRKMRHDLMPVKIKINPIFGRTAFWATE